MFPEEELVMEGFLDAFARTQNDRSVPGRLDRGTFEQLLIQDFTTVDRTDRTSRVSVVPRQADAKANLAKLKRAMRQKQVALVSELESTYMTPQEKQHAELNVRSLKHFISAVASLPSYEVDNIVRHLDRQGTGFVKVAQIQMELA